MSDYNEFPMGDYVEFPGKKWHLDKDPDSSLMYGINVFGIIEPQDTLVGTPVAVPGAGTGLVVGIASFVGTRIKARVSGGNVGCSAPLTWTWTTSGGDSDSRTVYLDIVQR